MIQSFQKLLSILLVSSLFVPAKLYNVPAAALKFMKANPLTPDNLYSYLEKNQHDLKDVLHYTLTGELMFPFLKKYNVSLHVRRKPVTGYGWGEFYFEYNEVHCNQTKIKFTDPELEIFHFMWQNCKLQENPFQKTVLHKLMQSINQNTTNGVVVVLRNNQTHFDTSTLKDFNGVTGHVHEAEKLRKFFRKLFYLIENNVGNTDRGYKSNQWNGQQSSYNFTQNELQLLSIPLNCRLLQKHVAKNANRVLVSNSDYQNCDFKGKLYAIELSGYFKEVKKELKVIGIDWRQPLARLSLKKILTGWKDKTVVYYSSNCAYNIALFFEPGNCEHFSYMEFNFVYYQSVYEYTRSYYMLGQEGMFYFLQEFKNAAIKPTEYPGSSRVLRDVYVSGFICHAVSILNLRKFNGGYHFPFDEKSKIITLDDRGTFMGKIQPIRTFYGENAIDALYNFVGVQLNGMGLKYTCNNPCSCSWDWA